MISELDIGSVAYAAMLPLGSNALRFQAGLGRWIQQLHVPLLAATFGSAKYDGDSFPPVKPP